MNTKLVLSSALITLIQANSIAGTGNEKTVKKPNILVILADDLGYGDVQCYNSQRGKILTPNIDRLASQGMRFTDGHSSSAVSSPSRYTLLTGRYHWRTRLQSGIVNLFGAPLIAPDRLIIAGLMKQHGYRTACIGKWHLGWDWPIDTAKLKYVQIPVKRSQDDETFIVTEDHEIAGRHIFSKPILNGPATRGFDSYFGTDVPNWPPYCFIDNNRTIGIPTKFLPKENFSNNRASLPGPALKDWQLEHILPTLGDSAVSFITTSIERSEPFFLYLPLTSPHTPLAVNKPWLGKSGLNTYADFVMETDAVIGRVLDALKKRNADENTLVIFTSDNGCAPYIGAEALEAMGHFPSGPLRGYKGDAWEGGHRVPFIIRWPSVVKPKSICNQLVHHADFMATFAEILGTKLPDGAGEDSYSLLSLLKGKDKPIRRQSVSCAIAGIPTLRVGSWKLISGSASGSFSKIRDDNTVKLFNLADDIGETVNLAASQPQRVAEMKSLLEKLINDGRSTPGEVQKNDVKVRRYPNPEK